MVSANLNVNIFYLGLERKFVLEIGIENKIDSNYPDIIWFKQGIFVTTGINTSRQSSSYQISITGKDKMCLLNGDVGGNLPYSVDFGTIEEISPDGSTITYKKVKIKDIIRHAVEELGGEQPYNIIINDLNKDGLEMLDYNGDKPLYAFYDESLNTFINITMDGDMEVYYFNESSNKTSCKLKEISENELYNPINGQEGTETIFQTASGKEIKIVKYTQGDAVGYRQTELIYPDDLIGNIGDTLTSILDKITAMLVNYEYFYDINGRFIFQKKLNCITWGGQEVAPGEGAEDLQYYYGNNKISSHLFYNFEDNDLVVSINNNPDYGNVKNDFSIWGTRKGITGADLPIHFRYAIDHKPIKYTVYQSRYGKLKANTSDNNVEYYQLSESIPTITYIARNDWEWTFDNSDPENIKIYCDWREIIYQMALDHNQFHDTMSDFVKQLIDNNRDDNSGNTLYPNGRTFYEQYYADILGFWRELYSPVGQPGYEKAIELYGGTNIQNPDKGFYRQIVLSPGTYKKGQYYIKQEHYTTENGKTLKTDLVSRFPNYQQDGSRAYHEDRIYYEKFDDSYNYKDNNNIEHSLCSRSDFITRPQDKNFEFEMLDTEGELGKYSVRAIGDRPKFINNSNIKSIDYREVPNLIFRDGYSLDDGFTTYYSLSNNGTETEYVEDYSTSTIPSLDETAYTYITSNTALENCFSTSVRGISARETVEDYLNEYTYYKETITMTTIPVYYMEPNVRISVKDSLSKMNGEYLVTKIAIPLTYNGTMSLTVSKIEQAIR